MKFLAPQSQCGPQCLDSIIRAQNNTQFWSRGLDRQLTNCHWMTVGCVSPSQCHQLATHCRTIVAMGRLGQPCIQQLSDCTAFPWTTLGQLLDEIGEHQQQLQQQQHSYSIGSKWWHLRVKIRFTLILSPSHTC